VFLIVLVCKSCHLPQRSFYFKGVRSGGHHKPVYRSWHFLVVAESGAAISEFISGNLYLRAVRDLGVESRKHTEFPNVVFIGGFYDLVPSSCPVVKD
jgi:hypothetical protein